MNHRDPNKLPGLFLILLFTLSLGLLLAACPTEAENTTDGNDKGDEDTITVQDGVYTLDFTVLNEQVRYLNLSTAEWVTDPAVIASPDWDIAFHASRLVYTNSGDTAVDLDSSGYGGVWFTNTTDFDAVTGEADKATVDTDNPDFDYRDYFQDTKRYVMIMGAKYYNRLNVMTYAGYPDEAEYNGLVEDKALAGNGGLVSYNYDKKQYYFNPPLPDGGLRMPPDFEATKQVYIIRHGNAADFSKFQITRFVRDFSDNSDHYTVHWKKFED
jgi:hypothetical protein